MEVDYFVLGNLASPNSDHKKLVLVVSCLAKLAATFPFVIIKLRKIHEA